MSRQWKYFVWGWLGEGALVQFSARRKWRNEIEERLQSYDFSRHLAPHPALFSASRALLFSSSMSMQLHFSRRYRHWRNLIPELIAISYIATKTLDNFSPGKWVWVFAEFGIGDFKILKAVVSIFIDIIWSWIRVVLPVSTLFRISWKFDWFRGHDCLFSELSSV